MSTLTTLKLSDLEIINDEPRIIDVVLAEAIGFARPRKIRELIVSNLETLKRFGDIAPRVGRVAKTTATVYHLNEKQALYIIAKSNTPTAAEMTVAMVEVFHAYRHGHLQPVQTMPAFPTTMYAKTLLEDGTEGNPATTKQVGRVLGEVAKLSKLLETIEEKTKAIDEKIRVYAVDSDTIASLDWIFSSTLDTFMKHKSYKDSTIQRLKEENACLKKSISLVVANQNNQRIEA